MSEFPTELQVLGVKYAVEQVADLYMHNHDHVDVDGHDHADGPIKVHGLHDGDAGIILIEATQNNDDVARKTMLHEVLHAVIFAAELDDILTGSEEERLVGRMSGVLYDVIQRNPALVAYLQGGAS